MPSGYSLFYTRGKEKKESYKIMSNVLRKLPYSDILAKQKESVIGAGRLQACVHVNTEFSQGGRDLICPLTRASVKRALTVLRMRVFRFT